MLPSPPRASLRTLRRVLNRGLVDHEFRRRRTRLRGRPYAVFVDPINSCNLRCPLCPTGLQSEGRARGSMSDEVFARVLSELGPFTTQMMLYNWGEPLLHKRIFDFVEAAEAEGIRTELSANLNLFDADRAERMVRSGLHSIILSIDGTRQETYARYRVGGDLATVKANARLLADAKRRLGSPLPRVILQFLVFKHNVGDLPDVPALGREIEADEVRIEGGHLGGPGQTPHVGAAETAGLAEQWLVDDPAYREEFDYFGEGDYLSSSACYFLWRSVVVHWDGAISPCCCVHESSTDFGNLMERPFAEIWNGEKYRSARHGFGRPARDGEHPVVCHDCRIFTPDEAGDADRTPT